MATWMFKNNNGQASPDVLIDLRIMTLVMHLTNSLNINELKTLQCVDYYLSFIRSTHHSSQEEQKDSGLKCFCQTDDVRQEGSQDMGTLALDIHSAYPETRFLSFVHALLQIFQFIWCDIIQCELSSLVAWYRCAFPGKKQKYLIISHRIWSVSAC